MPYFTCISDLGQMCATYEGCGADSPATGGRESENESPGNGRGGKRCDQVVAGCAVANDIASIVIRW